jgi:DNA polymerase-3 subunit beta
MGKSHLLFSFGSIEFLTRLIEGTYPNYEQVLPMGNTKTATIEKEALMKALRRVSIMSKERSSAVKADFETASMIISASNPDVGEAKDEIAMTYTGDAMSLAFNARYLLDALGAMGSGVVVMKLNEPLSPVLLTEEGTDDYKCVVMPMRL